MNLQVLITRPRHLSRKLAQTLSFENIQSVIFPTVDIHGMPNAPELLAVLNDLSQFDMFIFTSQAAVDYAVRAHLSSWRNVSTSIVYAVGPATSSLLRSCGLKNVAYPKTANSENLITLLKSKRIRNKPIAIFSGVGGKDIVYEDLRTRGANVKKIDCYQRQLPDEDIIPLVDKWKHIDVVVCTSGDTVRNLVTLLGETLSSALFSKPLLVISESMLHLAKELGFSGDVIVASNASNKAIKEALLQAYAGRDSTTIE